MPTTAASIDQRIERRTMLRAQSVVNLDGSAVEIRAGNVENRGIHYGRTIFVALRVQVDVPNRLIVPALNTRIWMTVSR
jgi:hypothetical protein